ncbi:glycosyltransferase family 1 protein [Bacillus cereus]|uniref:glycosyltransferase family 1 protein n=1 Tax=Bacillus cereus TaxID=1396 RepID=UPI002853133F|nr:glycosyltransferase family 1 protein [Bacillus cereus]MDR4983677.1 glycosyltransferase family 1 protein [Bacillus cereus]MEA1011316.1 glycosyltransferase family 1 protein [Bacillus cereus]
MSKVSCNLRLGEIPLHLYHLTAGFALLAQQGVIDLTVEKLTKSSKERLPYNMMEVIINNQIKLVYDVNDGYDNLLEIEQDYAKFMDGILEKCDFYFKRSFSKIYNSQLVYKDKIYPLGLNYMVTVPHNIAHMPMPYDPHKEKVKKLIRMLPFSEYNNKLYHINSFEEVPKSEAHPKVLFMARLWDVNGDYPGQISIEKREERAYINEFRAECIRLCRKEFGNRFYGGVMPSNFASKSYRDILIEDKKIIKRNNYLKKVKESAICIATMGLHESIGWKFAEYVAASRAIVTESLKYEVTGDFLEEKNYLVFRKPEECLNQVYRLLEDEEFRYKMMLNNYEYYHEYVRPDRLVLNSIFTVLQKSGYSWRGEVV